MTATPDTHLNVFVCVCVAGAPLSNPVFLIVHLLAGIPPPLSLSSSLFCRPHSLKKEPPGGPQSIGLSAGSTAQRLIAAAAALLCLQQRRLGVGLSGTRVAMAEEAGPAIHQTVEKALRG